MQNSLVFPQKVIAHRGASGYAPENTLAAFMKAAELTIAWVEFDVMQTSCGEVIIFHDELLDRTTNSQGDISQLSYAQIKKLDAGSWFDFAFAAQVVPTLKQTLQFLSDHHMSANIEFKSLPGAEEKLVLNVLEEMQNFKNFSATILYSSFSIEAMQALQHYAPDSLKGLLLHEWEKDWQATSKSLNYQSIHVNEEILSAASVREIKDLQKLVLSYTVNDVARARQLFAWGVDAVFSDFPDKIAQVAQLSLS